MREPCEPRRQLLWMKPQAGSRGDRSCVPGRTGRGGLLRRLAGASVPVLVVLGLVVAPASGAGYAGSRSEAPAPVRVTAVAGGVYHSLAVTSAGVAFGWGWNITGQLCDGTTTGSDVPVKVALPASAKVIGIAAGFAHSVVVTSAGQAFACGKNDDGDLGDGNTSTSDVPMKVDLPVGTRVTAVSAGSDDGLAVTSTGAVLAWGENDTGQLGDDGTAGSDVPVSVDLPKGTRVTAVAAGSQHSLALTSTGAVLAWGYNAAGQLGDGNKANSDVPVQVRLPAGTKVTAIAAGGYYSLALTSTGTVFAWGYDADGELGDGTRADSDVPVKVKLPPGTRVTRIAAGGVLVGVGEIAPGPGHSLAVTSTGAVLAWGYNAEGQLGDGNKLNSVVPVKVKLPAGFKVTGIAAGQLQSLAVTSTGAVFAWGGNNFGQLGDGGYEGSDIPVKVVLP